MRRVWWLAFLIAAPIASATPVFPLEGQLLAKEPWRASGVLVAEPMTGSLFHATPNHALFVQTLLESPAANVQLIRWEGTDVVAIQTYPFTEPRTLTGLSVEVLATEGRPQIAMLGAAATIGSEASPAGCALENTVHTRAETFPQDPQANGHIIVGGYARTLEAQCEAGVASDSFEAVLLYGLRLRLRHSERDEEIRTGTFREPAPGGLAGDRVVTQMLRVEPAGSAVNVRIPPGKVRMQSSSFEVLGLLSVPQTEGPLRWGDASAEGAHEAFDAGGWFKIGWHPERRIRVSGSTVDAPIGEATTAARSREPTAVAGAIATLGLTAAWFLSWLYSRLAGEDVLTHPRRARIYEFVKANPGATPSQVARELGLGRTRALYHLQRLARNGHVRFHRFGGRWAIMPMASRGAEDWLAVAARPTPRRVLVALRDLELDQAAIQLATGLSQPAVSRSLLLLRRAGAVVAQRRGRRVRYRTTRLFEIQPQSA